MNRIVVLGSSAAFPLPRTKTNLFEDYLSIARYQKQFPLHSDALCESAKRPNKDRRTRSCIALDHKGKTILFDAGPDIRYQLKRASLKADAVFITHEHADACWGTRFLPFGVQVYSEKKHTLQPDKPLRFGEVTVSPFRVIHSRTVPTVGFRVSVPYGRKKKFVFIYATDVASLRGLRKYYMSSDLVFADGSILSRNLPGHRAILHQLRLYKQWRLKKVYFTHIGHQTLPHEQLRKFLQKRYTYADIAYDGLTIPIP